MTERATQSTIVFSAPFSLPGFDVPLQSGPYTVSTEEQGTEVAGHLVYRRTATILRVEAGGKIEYHAIDPAALEVALRHDREAAARIAQQGAELPEPNLVEGERPWRSISKWMRIERPDHRG